MVLIDVGPKSTTGIPEAQGASKENRTIRLAVLDAHSGNTLTTSTFVIEGVGFGDEYVQLSLQEDLAKKLERLRPRF